MTAQIYQIRDYQSPKDLERMRQQMAAEIKVDVPEMVPYHGAGGWHAIRGAGQRSSVNENDLDWFAARLAIAVHETRRLTPEMSVLELRAALRGVEGSESLTMSYAPNGNQLIHIGDKTLEIGPMASNAEIEAALQNPFVRTENTRLTVSLKDRLQEKARLASSIVSSEVKALEDGMDAIIAEKDAVAQKRQAAIAATSDVLGVVKDQWDGIKSSVDILSNGAPE